MLVWWCIYYDYLAYFLAVILRISKVADKRRWPINGKPTSYIETVLIKTIQD